MNEEMRIKYDEPLTKSHIKKKLLEKGVTLKVIT